MPYVIRPTRRLRAVVGLALAAFASTAAPASAATTSPCVTPSFKQIFLPWNDRGWYTLSPGGSFESGASGWTLSGARVVAGNEPFYVGGSSHRSSLSIAPGGSATSAPMCIDRTYPKFRFFARNTGLQSTQLNVDVLWLQSGRTMSWRAILPVKPGPAWAPVVPLRLPTGALSTGALEPVQFRFSAVGAGGNWQIDDLYVDPYMRR